MATKETIAITGATGQLGRLVIAELQRLAPQARLIAVVRNAAAAQNLKGFEVRAADYEKPDTLAAAFAGVERLLLISSSEVGRRAKQHGNAIEAAKAARVKLIAYTSILRADTNPMALAVEHRATEQMLRASGLPTVLLRNGWYNENYAGNAAAAVQHGGVPGAAGNGRISSAARADYAAAAATVLADDAGHAGKTYELAGDTAYTLAAFAAEIARQSGKPVVYKNLLEADYKAVLQGVGLPEPLAEVLAESDTKAANDVLFDDGRQLSRLIGRPTTTIAQSIAATLAD